MTATRIRSTNPTSVKITGSGGGTSTNPPGSSLTTDDLGAIEIMLAETAAATPTENNTFAVAVSQSDDSRAYDSIGTYRVFPTATAPVTYGNSANSAFGKVLIFDGSGTTDANTPGIVISAIPRASAGVNFTVEMRLRVTASSPLGCLWFHPDYNITLQPNVAGSVKLVQTVANADNTSVSLSSPAVINLNTDYSVAIQKVGNELRLFIDGVFTNSISWSTFGSTNSPTLDTYVGRYPGATSYPFTGWLDEIRYSTIQRYAGNYTPATAPFNPDASTAVLMHMDQGVLVAPLESTAIDITAAATDSASVPTHTQTMQVFYSGSGTWTAPPGVTSVTVECWGGGTAGNNASATASGNGGPGGSYAKSTFAVTPGNTYTVTVSPGIAAGNGGAPGGNNPAADSWFGSTTTILARGGGSASTNVGTVIFAGGPGGTGGVGTGGGGGGAGAGTSSDGSAGGSAAIGGVGAGGAGVAGNTNGGGGTGGAGTTGGVGGGGGLVGGGGGGGGSSPTSPGFGGQGNRGEVRVSWNT